MHKIEIGQNVPAFSRIVYGLWRLADDTNTTADHITRKVELCLDQGITTFDHADIYGDYSCEKLFGDALRQRSDLKSKMQIVTKCGIMLVSETALHHRVKHYDTSPAHIRQSVENSLSNIGVDVIDLLLIHRPDPFMDHHKTGAVLDALVNEGKVRGIGVSNFMRHDTDLLQSAMSNPLLTNQIEISLAHQSAFTDGTIADWQRLNRPLMSWSPLGGGSIFSPNDAVGKRIMPRLTELGNEYGVDVDAVALAWLIAHPATILPVVGTNNLARIEKLSDALKVKIDRQTWYELATLATGFEVP